MRHENETAKATVKRVLAMCLCIQEDEISDTASLRDDLHVDSLDQVEIVMALEDEFGIEIKDDEIDELLTVQQVIERFGKAA